jgi:2-methylcitrate dehydratase
MVHLYERSEVKEPKLNLAEKLSDYVRSISYRNLDEELIFETKKRILDSLGCAIGSFNQKPVKIARHVMQNSYKMNSSTILGTRSKTSEDMAAFVNGLMVRYFDYNDTYLSKEPAHPSDNIPACFAVAESEENSGKDLLLSIALAYEIQCRLCDAADIRHRGWDHVCYGLVSSSLSAGLLMGLDASKLTHALNIALNAHIAMRQVRAGELSEWKGCSFANAARNSIFSAVLARDGLTGPSPIFEGEMGFFNQVSGAFDLDFENFGGRNESSFKLPQTYIKYFPAEYHSQSAIWAALEIRKEVRVEDIALTTVFTHEAGYTILGKGEEKWAPSTKETADHSLPYIVGMALLKGSIDNTSYSKSNMTDERMLSFIRNIRVIEDSDLTKMYPNHIANRIEVKLKDGSVISKQVNDPLGHPNNPMTKDQVEAKFSRLVRNFLSPEQAHKIANYVWSIDRKSDLTELLGLCAIKGKN